MPIRRSQKKSNAEPRQKQNHRRLVIDPMVNPGSSPHRHQARSKADPTRPHHRMVTLAQSSPGDRSARAPQSKTTTVMLGQLGYELVEQRGLRGSQAGVYNQFGTHVLPWTRHFKNCRDLLRRAIDVANKNGDLTFSDYSCHALTTNLLAVGDPLPEVQREVE